MTSFQGYKLKPAPYTITRDDIVIRVTCGAEKSPLGCMAIAVSSNTVYTATQISRTTAPSFWRAIETLPGCQAKAGDTVYCISSSGSCELHDVFKVDSTIGLCLRPRGNHQLLKGEITQATWTWPKDNFVVLVKEDTSSKPEDYYEYSWPNRKEIYQDLISSGYKFNPPTSDSEYDLYILVSHNKKEFTTSSTPFESSTNEPTPVDPYSAKVGDYVEWHGTGYSSITKGSLYKVTSVNTRILHIINDRGLEDYWYKDGFKRIFTNDTTRPLIDTIEITDTQTKPTQITKETSMNPLLFTDILKLLLQAEQTDLDTAPSTYAFFYDPKGNYHGTASVANESEAKALLQKPELLGFTMRIYSFTDEFTTSIPVVSTIKKPTVAKAPRATKAK